MSEITKLVPKWLLIVIGLLFGLLILSLCLFIILPIFSGGNGGVPDQPPQDQTSPNDDGPRTQVGVVDESGKVKYAGITEEGTLIFINNNDEEVVVNLTVKNWQNLKWSPGGKVVSVLAETSPKVFDLFIYNFSTQVWDQITRYNEVDTGITGYEWVSDDRLVFTQGPANEIWLHNYDYPNSELEKDFKIEARLVDYLTSERQLIFAEKTILDGSPAGLGKNISDQNFLIYDLKGNKLQEINGSQNSNLPIVLNSVTSGRNQREFIFTANDLVAKETVILAWSFVRPELRELLRFNPHGFPKYYIGCERDRNFMYGLRINQAGSRLGLIEMNGGSFASIGDAGIVHDGKNNSLPIIRFSCLPQKKIVRVETSRNGRIVVDWFDFSGGKFSRIFFKSEYSELVVNPGF